MNSTEIVNHHEAAQGLDSPFLIPFSGNKEGEAAKFGQLTVAQTNQLTADFIFNPAVFETTVELSYRTCDERMQLREAFATYDSHRSIYGFEKTCHQTLEGVVGKITKNEKDPLDTSKKHSKVIRAAHSAGGAVVRELKKEMTESKKVFLEQADQYSRECASFFEGKLRADQNPIIFGKAYEYESGILITGDSGAAIVLGSIEAMMLYRRRATTLMTPRDAGQYKIRPLEIDGWISFLDEQDLIQHF